MAAPDCRLLVWFDSPRAFVKILGRATAPAAPDFVALLDQLVAGGNKCFVFEVSECVLMDSTFVGKLAQFALAQTESASPPEPGASRRLMLVNPGSHIIELLDTIYVLDLFEVVYDATAAEAREDAETKTCTSRTREEVNQCCLEAHKALAALAPENAAKFQDVIRFLEQSAGGKG